MFEGYLEDANLLLYPKIAFSDEISVRNALKPLLRSWEIHEAVLRGKPQFTFVFEHTEFDGNNGNTTRYIEATRTIPYEHNSWHEYDQYPSPPSDFEFSSTPLMEILWQRFDSYLKGKEPLPSMAYACLTLLEKDADRFRTTLLQKTSPRKLASKGFKIDCKILQKFGELSTELGTSSNARKFSKKSPVRNYTPAEESWLKETIKKIIFHLGKQAAKPDQTNLPWTIYPHLHNSLSFSS